MYQIQYRLLNEEEKEYFYKDFINFLSVHGIDGEEWNRIKKEDKKQATLYFAQFSDLILDRSLQNIKYLLKVEEQSVQYISTEKSEMEIYSLALENTISLEDKTQEEIVNVFKENNFTVSQTTVPYLKIGREQTLFSFLNKNGFEPCNKDILKLIKGK